MAQPNGARTNARGRARREQLIGAAVEAFGAHGFRGTSLAAIAAQVGISEPGVIHHFGSKERLLLGVLEDHEALDHERVARETATARGSFADGVIELAGDHEAAPAFIRLFTVLAAESVDPAHPAHEWFVTRYQRVRAHMSAAIAEEQRQRRLTSAIDADHLAALIVAVLDGLELQFLLDPDRTDIVTPLTALFNRLAEKPGPPAAQPTAPRAGDKEPGS